jgi:hypothetical protein
MASFMVGWLSHFGPGVAQYIMVGCITEEACSAQGGQEANTVTGRGQGLNIHFSVITMPPPKAT